MSYSVLAPLIMLIPLSSILYKYSSLLTMLICLEMSTLILMFMTISLYGNAIIKEPFMLLLIVSFGACEGALGLSLLVTIMRSFGNQNMMNLTMLKC